MARPKKDKEAEKKKQEVRVARIAQEKIEREELEKQVPKKKELTIEQRLDRLEFVVAKMAHYKGCAKIIIENDLKPWIPGRRDMTKWKNEHPKTQ